jgi:hypothetical protein
MKRLNIPTLPKALPISLRSLIKDIRNVIKRHPMEITKVIVRSLSNSFGTIAILQFYKFKLSTLRKITSSTTAAWSSSTIPASVMNSPFVKECLLLLLSIH